MPGRGSHMRYSMIRAMKHFNWPYDSFTGENFLQFFKGLPTSSGTRRKIYPANASATAMHLGRIARENEGIIEVVEGQNDPKRFRRVINNGEEETSSD